MSMLKYIDRLKRMDYLIRRKATGTPDEFAGKLGICKSMLMINLSELKEMGAEVKYNPQLRSYCYEGNYVLKLGFELEKSEASRIKGGENVHSNLIRIPFSTLVTHSF